MTGGSRPMRSFYWVGFWTGDGIDRELMTGHL